MVHAGVVLQNRYEILKMVGRGGMSTVYQARDLNTGSLLAVKDVKRSGKEQDQVVEQSLTAEGRMLMQLTNPHLPRIYDIIENQESFMLVMDFIHGESLDKVIARTGAQSVEQTLDWGMQICEVFHYLHSQPQPIIYRDMKPANVMLQPNGQLMMIDFGTARTQKDGVQMQADTVCIGTAGFAAPEQYGGIGQSTARTDIFCLGATLYNMVTGHSPCDWPKGILPLEQWNPALEGSAIAEIIYKCTRNDPNERYQTAMELHEDLRLASVGAYRGASRKGRTGGISGGARKTGWQKQDVQGRGIITEGLSGLLHRGRTGLIAQNGGLSAPEQAPGGQTIVQGGSWQTQQPAAASIAQVQTDAAGQEEQEPFLHKLTLIAVMIAAIFMVLTVVLTLLGQVTAAVVFLVIGLAAAVIGVMGLIMSGK